MLLCPLTLKEEEKKEEKKEEEMEMGEVERRKGGGEDEVWCRKFSSYNVVMV